MNLELLKSIVSKMDFYFSKFNRLFMNLCVSVFGRLLFPILILKNSKTYIHACSYFPELERKSKQRIFWEQIFWCLKYGDINKYYFMWGCDVKGRTSKDFVPWLRWVNARQRLNKEPKTPIYDFYNQVGLLRDKFYFEAILKKTGFKTPHNIMMINDCKLYVLGGEIHTSAIDITEIINYNIDAFCKRNCSYGGGMDKDVFPIKIYNSKIIIGNKEILLDEFIKIFSNNNSSWIIQERIDNQSDFMAQFHPDSINTIRVVTVKRHKKIYPICAFARFGVNGRSSDNWSSGGLLVGINIVTGEFEKYALMRPGVGTKQYRHPNTGIEFENKVVPDWANIVQYVKDLHEVFYDIHSIGWDIVLTTNGPLVIEGNDNWDTIDAQFYYPGKDIYNKYFK